MRLRFALYVVSIILMVSSFSFAEHNFPFSLRLERLESKEVLIDLPIHPGEQFYIHYIHSSDKTPIRDTFRVNEEGQIILIEEAYLWYGAGLEFQNHHQARLIRDGQWIKVQLNRPFPILPVRVGRVAQQIFIFRDQSIRMDRLVSPGDGILFFITR